MSSDAASRRIGAFIQRFGPAHLALACHAAFPLALTPDLLYRLWAHFQLDAQGAPLRVPWEAVADLLLSGMCREVGHELYELDSAVRAALLRELRDSPRFGRARIAELSRFLIHYVSQLLLSDNPDERSFADAQNMIALGYVRPDEAMRALQRAAKQAAGAGRAERVRMRALIEAFEAPLGEHAEFATLLADVRATAQPAQPAQTNRGAPRRKANPRQAGTTANPEAAETTPRSDDEQTSQLLAQRDRLRRRLNELERRRALYGIDLPVEIVNDIQDTGRALAAIETQLAGNPPPEQETAPADDYTRELLDQRDNQRRRLRALEQQEAYYGVNAPAHIVTQIDEARRELDKIHSQLRATGLPAADGLDALDADGIEHLQLLRLTKLRRLSIRERQKAALGDQAEPVVDNEINVLRGEIAQIEQQLRAAGVAPADPPAPAAAPVSPQPLGDEERAQLANLRHTTQRRLREREKQRATMGDSSARPEILMEIEDLQARLGVFDSQLGTDSGPGSDFASTTDALAHTQEIRRIKQRRLGIIENMVARYGSQAPKHLVDESDTLRAEIAQIEQQLFDAGVTPSDSNTIPLPTPAPTQSAAPALDPDEHDALEAQYHMIKRRLQILERQQALLGNDTPPEVSTEIEDLRRQLAALASRLGGAPPAPAPAQPPPPASPEQRPLLEAQHEVKTQQLRALEEQRARYGEARVPPEVVIQVEDLREEIANLNSRLGIAAEAPAANQTGGRTELEQLRAIRLERLRVLETQQARYGADLTPASLLLDIEELRNQIADLDLALGAIEQTAGGPPDPNTTSVTTRWGTLRLGAAIDGLAAGAPLRIGQLYQIQVALQLAPSEIAQVHSQASASEQVLELELALDIWRIVQPDPLERPMVRPEDTRDLNDRKRHVRLAPGEQPSHVFFQFQPTHTNQALLMVEASAEGTLLLQHQLTFDVQDAPPAEQQAPPQTNAQAAPDEPTLERSSQLDVAVALYDGAEPISIGPNRTYALTISQLYALQVSVQLTNSLTEDSIAMSLGELPLHRRIVLQAHNLTIEGEHQKEVQFTIGGPWATADFILRPETTGAATLIVSTYHGDALDDQQRLRFEVQGTPPAEQQGPPSADAPATPAQAPDESALMQSKSLNIGITLYHGSERLAPDAKQTYTLTAMQTYTVQVEVHMLPDLSSHALAFDYGDMLLESTIEIETQNLEVEGERKQGLQFYPGSADRARFVIRPRAAGTATLIVSTYYGDPLDDRQRLDFEVLAAPMAQA